MLLAAGRELAVGSIRSWEVRDELVHLPTVGGSAGLDHVGRKSISAALAACIQARAWEGEMTLELDTSVDDHKELDDTLRQLQLQGLVKSLEADPSNVARRSWQITAAGAGAMRCGIVLHSPRKAVEPRPGLSVGDMTCWELVCKLQDDGWAARVASSPTGLQPARPDGTPVFWFKRGSKRVHKSYLLALNHRDRLFGTGLQEILHLKDAQYYDNLLSRIGISRGRGRAQRRKLLLLPDDHGAAVVNPVRQPISLQPTGARETLATDLLPTKKTRATGTRREVHPRSYVWGPHRMTFVSPRGWRALCCLMESHGKPGKRGTRCNRTIRYKGPDGGEDDLRAQRMALRWLNLCREHKTRESHMGVKNNVLLSGLPSFDDLRSACLPDDQGEMPRGARRIRTRITAASTSSSGSSNSGSSSSNSTASTSDEDTGRDSGSVARSSG